MEEPTRQRDEAARSEGRSAEPTGRPFEILRPEIAHLPAPPSVAPVDFDAPPADPVALLRRWLKEAERCGLPNPNAISLATIDPDGRPSLRILLLRALDERGAVFFTNRESRKGTALAANPRAALCLHWDPLDRQVRIEGGVTQTSDAESDLYFAQRSRTSQINAWASSQSQPIESRAAMAELQERFRRRFEGAEVPRPPHWGGYRVSLDRIEFWQGDRHRFHDRMVYFRLGEAWRQTRLCP
ncbi:MAG TPA: pyridoxamine 5'-phosphate oxidase [Phycisphaerales bacterium]|nr:pyridoxamine 5'-phosphate oxidase [Phycisphaerales bacterium]HMP38431.1 pyridoxamine 5'-phosphate oxidase [Phycisphaerales bacterium]